MMRRMGGRVVQSEVQRLTSARRMVLWDLLRNSDSETARALAQELTLQDQLRASVAREDRKRPAMTTHEAPPAEALVRVQPQSQLAPVLPESKYELLRDTYAKGATPAEFELFVSVCNRLRLDPFARQIYAVKRWNTDLRREEMQAQVSIDGMRLTAQRTGEYRGQSAPEWCGADGIWKDVWLSNQPPAAARVLVYREGFSQPVSAIALYREYVQRKKDGEPTKFWRDMPANQLAKCAESLALRKAFPNELSGVYSVDEMAQAEVVSEAPRTTVAATSTPVSTPVSTSAPAANGGGRVAQPKQPPAAPPASAPGPCFASSFSRAGWADKPMRDAPIEVLADYIAYCEGVLADDNRKRLHPRARASKQLAEAIYREAAEREMASVAKPQDIDPITAGLEAEYARTHGAAPDADADDFPESWNR